MECKTLQKFQKTLKERLTTLQGHIATANHTIIESSCQSGDQADMISANTQWMLNSSLLNQYELEVRDIMNSLEKIKHNTFGVCEMCGDDIDEERLWIKPHAKYCIVCREIYEKSL